MAKMSLADLKAMRDEKKKEIIRRDSDKSITITIGMGTCGIAAGAKESFDALIKELEAADVDDVVIKQTGCMGFCAVEPTIMVSSPDMPETLYNKMTADVIGRLVKEHIVGKSLISEHVFDKPSKDIMAD